MCVFGVCVCVFHGCVVCLLCSVIYSHIYVCACVCGYGWWCASACVLCVVLCGCVFVVRCLMSEHMTCCIYTAIKPHIIILIKLMFGSRCLLSSSQLCFGHLLYIALTLHLFSNVPEDGVQESSLIVVRTSWCSAH